MKTKTLPDVCFEHPFHGLGNKKATPSELAAFEAIVDGKTEGVHGIAGAQLGGEIAILRTSPVNAYALFVRLGGNVMYVGAVHPGNPGVAALFDAGAMVTTEKSPGLLRHERRREEERRKAAEAAEAYAKERGRLAAERERRAAEQRAKNRAALSA